MNNNLKKVVKKFNETIARNIIMDIMQMFNF